MEERLRTHMDYLFEGIPMDESTKELKEEIVLNLIDKYHDLLAQGKSEEAAFSLAIASIGDIRELLNEYTTSGKSENNDNNNSDFNSTNQGGTANHTTYSSPAMTKYEQEYAEWKKKKAVLTSISVMLYILCVVPPILTEMLPINENLGAVGLFVFIAIATSLLVYNSYTKPHPPKTDGSMVEEFKEWKKEKDDSRTATKSIRSMVWSLTTALYFVVSFTTGAWYVTWVIFLMGSAVNSLIKAITDLRK